MILYAKRLSREIWNKVNELQGKAFIYYKFFIRTVKKLGYKLYSAPKELNQNSPLAFAD
ncbi:hypothetical protein GCM10008106_37380 [Mongoliitalea lutea]|uniref:Uncharacterized protein n=1 Tax=Mongoliitalea lutea TaxID=849756 RepID=A0A8J3G776_9BACT|nr:hypothetical protein GCM10008106_37380 [Mongoliitalea lutea]